jgi:hypothetical protein
VYHLELRKFPHVACRFNQSEQQMRAIVMPWVGEQWVEEGERNWNINESALTILEGPELAMPELAMGRGWRTAQRRGEDVTERVLSSARQALAQSPPPTSGAGSAAAGSGEDADSANAASSANAAPASAAGAAGSSQLLADSLGLELLSLLDDGPVPLPRVWVLAHERLGAPTAAESLALGEQAVRSLLARGLVVVGAGGAGDASTGGGGAGPGDGGDDLEALLHAVASWSDSSSAPPVIARRA